MVLTRAAHSVAETRTSEAAWKLVLFEFFRVMILSFPFQPVHRQ